ncbi:DUF3078 domain-containing protein [Mucilaginibacter arboris]|uniref:DUF3078 domain-containing protein n=1 Tax=Mucilaginibacter arboris TaxID=2682090 RepID=A0A7K1SSK1_9SPHI|nr:DUF3078 domain-containing protein [Mucilaginibacter arboris]MVN20275.1 DUF3078 domain-containing protein [Mucilaginibacter arboris]
MLLLPLLFINKTLAQKRDSIKRDTVRTDTIRTDTVKTDTVKIDTNLLNRFRIEPGRNILPVHLQPLSLRPEFIPVPGLDYKVSYWRKNIIFGLNINQSAFSNNWSSGGISSIAVGSNFDYKTEYNKEGKDFISELIMQYGKVKNRGQVERKTNDRIFWDNKVSINFSKHWDFYGSLSFESQFDEGFTYSSDPTVAPVLISRFMAPGYLTESIGFEYKPAPYFTARFGTGTARQTFVLDDAVYHGDTVAYGVRLGNHVLNQLAFQVVSNIDKDIAKNMNLKARYLIFIPYDTPFKMTHRLDATLTAKINRLFNVTLNGTLLYDPNTSVRLQAYQSLALGVTYKFPSWR